jgi:hypothetical protein
MKTFILGKTNFVVNFLLIIMSISCHGYSETPWHFETKADPSGTKKVVKNIDNPNAIYAFLAVCVKEN